jgi:uncharacterized protein YbcI
MAVGAYGWLHSPAMDSVPSRLSTREAVRAAPGEDLAEISRRLVGLHRRFYGRGATRAKTFWVHDDMLLIEMHDIFITVEHTLLSKGQEDAVRATRQTFQAAMRDEFQRTIEEITGRRVLNYDSVMFTHPPSLLEIFVLEPQGDRRFRLDREAKEDAGSKPRPSGGLVDYPDAGGA